MPAAAAAGIAIALTAGPAAAAEEAREPMLVVIRASAPVRGAFVRLREVADLPNDPHRLREFAGEILLGFSPGTGAVREIAAEDVATRLREAGLAPDLFSINGARRTAVFLDEGTQALPGDGEGTLGVESESSLLRRAAAARSEAPPPAARREVRRPAPLVARVEGRAKADRDRESVRAPAPRSARDPGTNGASGGSGLEDHDLEKGEVLVLRTSGQALFLEEPVRVLGGGPSPDLIEVQNIRTGKKLLARVVDRGVVARAETPPPGERE